MKLAPFGVLNNDQKKELPPLYQPMADWRDGDAVYRSLIENWLGQVTETIWPAWVKGDWVGQAAINMEAATREELLRCVELYQGGENSLGALDEIPDVPPTPDNRKPNHEWHYKIEDALVRDPKFKYLKLPVGEKPSYDFRASNRIGSNFLVYDPKFGIKKFEMLFWGRMPEIEPSTFSIKLHLQRPRPWTAVTALGIEGFRWVVADGITHTGVHPSLLSGHCIQGILGGCSVFEDFLKSGANIESDRKRAIQKYMVDWGDRRVFAGVHYMTDNIASWTLARRLIPHLFENAAGVEALAVEAITQHSRVFADIVAHFPEDNPARLMLLQDFPEALTS